MKKLIFLLAIVMLTLVACTENDTEDTSEQEEREVPVEVEEVTKGNLDMQRTFYGRTTPNETTPVIPQVAGEVDELNVENGEEVEKDDDIATIKSVQGNIKVEAPASGYIIELNASEESLVSNQEPMAVIVDLNTLTVQLQVPDVQLDLFEEDKEVTLKLESAAEETYKATIEHVSKTANEAGLFPVELSFDNETTHYRAGVVATVTMEETVVEDSLLIPTAALVEENNETFVYTVSENTAKKVPVTVQATQSELTAITGELNEGDPVITSGQFTLNDGTKIKTVGEE
ncbi:multidrug efflux pump subunit AcrA (membrane-fusion protein) [Gracilibacillus halotolerans]|uniref:Multidrug efflux pump subunit AcrA (Membrane-fusion protein) n=1 Tax=Gracilibacillus halotolerans TaxID=74386 RepID=A0A841RM77_9BACI|nr:efflux RND transporter periplasmic adaptor subunit [Gracilibacillus halotolerans]MBB6513599.1 multidrug efflux pump subunit AcrA (membrane-fusion protein) [Gracilibacillus halotolerans]